MKKKSVTLQKIHALLLYYGITKPIDIEREAEDDLFEILIREDVAGAEVDSEGGLIIHFYEPEDLDVIEQLKRNKDTYE
jgi:hypothetical protein